MPFAGQRVRGPVPVDGGGFPIRAPRRGAIEEFVPRSCALKSLFPNNFSLLISLGILAITP